MVATTLAVVAALAWFFERTRIGKGMLATAYNRLAAELVGVDVRRVVSLSFVLSAAIGAIGGALIAPIANASYDAGDHARPQGVRRRDARRARARASARSRAASRSD